MNTTVFKQVWVSLHRCIRHIKFHFPFLFYPKVQYNRILFSRPHLSSQGWLQGCAMASNLSCYQIVGAGLPSGPRSLMIHLLLRHVLFHFYDSSIYSLQCPCYSFKYMSIYLKYMELFSRLTIFPPPNLPKWSFPLWGLTAAPHIYPLTITPSPKQWLLSLFSPFFMSVGVISSSPFLSKTFYLHLKSSPFSGSWVLKSKVQDFCF